MTWNRRYFIEAVLFAIIIVVLYLAWQIVQGMFLTASYVPDIVDSYESVDHLDHSVSFGFSASGQWGWTAAISTAVIAGLAAGYYAVRHFISKKRV